jgi:hypothetical protein
MSSLEIEVDVNEAYIQRVQPGQKVEATLDAYRDWAIPAHVITTIPAADRQKATVTVRIAFDQLDPAHPPGHGDQGRVPRASRGAARRGARGRASARARSAGSVGQEFVFVVGGRHARAARGHAGAGRRTIPARSWRALAGERVVVAGRPTLAAGRRSRSSRET